MEKEICMDKSLYELDSLMRQNYEKALINSSNASQLESEQRAWLNRVKDKCMHAACIRQAYISRNEELKKLKVENK